MASAPAPSQGDRRTSSRALDRILFHVDMDAFYASVHALENPGLAHKPLVIGADPKGGHGRGVVSTANYAARRYGIHSAMPISKAWEACPHATFLPPDFRLYKPASHDVMEVLSRYADELGGEREPGGATTALQVVGLDEAYLDVTTQCNGDWNRARALAHSLQAAVKRRTGLACSIGVAPSKSVAKIASDHRKPHGITVVWPQEIAAFLDPLPVRLINGCGPKTARALEEFDIPTVGELARADPAFMESRFGKHGLWLHAVAQGNDHRPVEPDRGPAKSRGNERTYARDETRRAAVLESAHKLLCGLLTTSDNRAFATLTVKVRYSDFTTLTRAHTLSIPLQPGPAEAKTLAWATCSALLAPLLDGRAVRLVGVRLSGFQEHTGQASLRAFGVRLPSPVAIPA